MNKRIYLGAAYYPELWPLSEVDTDIRNMKELGINVVRIGEFAWSSFEPEEGHFTFGWLKDVMDKLYEAGIMVVLGTPSCTPPRWLIAKYPDVLNEHWDRKLEGARSRVHICKTSENARRMNRIIASEMAKALGNHPALLGWQIDNEFFMYEDGCYCKDCRKAFQEYVKKEFVSVDELNEAWDMKRWSLDYPDFSFIIPPHEHEWNHPSLFKKWMEFQEHQIKTFSDEQAEEIRKYSILPIGTDLMCNNVLGYYTMNENLDVVEFNHYEKECDLEPTAFWYDFLRCVKGKPFWVTETQVGWNGGFYANSGYRHHGNVYANTWLPVSKGAEMQMYWLYRAQRSGQELAHGAVVSSCNRPYLESYEIKRLSEDFKKTEEFLLESEVKSDTALLFSTIAAKTLRYAPYIETLKDYKEFLNGKYYPAFYHHNIDIIDAPHSLESYKTILIPFMPSLEDMDFKERLIKWVNEGGCLIAGPMTDFVDSEIRKYSDKPYSILEDLAGVYVKYQSLTDTDEFKAEWMDGTTCHAGNLFDAYEVKDGTKSLVKYTEGDFKGYTAVALRSVGKGKVILCGTVLGVNDIKKLIGNPIADASDNVVLTERSGKHNGIIAVECCNKSGYLKLTKKYKDLLTGNILEGRIDVSPYQVYVLEEM